MQGFKACPAVPRLPTGDIDFIVGALSQLATRHDNLLELVVNVAEEDPFVALRLLQVCGVNRFGDILSAVPLESTSIFAEQRDLAITRALAVI